MNQEELKEAEQLLRKHQADEAWRKRQDVALMWWEEHYRVSRETYVKLSAAVDAAYEEGIKEGRRLAAAEREQEKPQ